MLFSCYIYTNDMMFVNKVKPYTYPKIQKVFSLYFFFLYFNKDIILKLNSSKKKRKNNTKYENIGKLDDLTFNLYSEVLLYEQKRKHLF